MVFFGLFFFFWPAPHPLAPLEVINSENTLCFSENTLENLTEAETRNVSLEPEPSGRNTRFPCAWVLPDRRQLGLHIGCALCLAPSEAPDASSYASFGESSCITGIRKVPETNFK